MLLRIDGAIGPATQDYVTRNIADAAKKKMHLLLYKLIRLVD